MKTIKISIQDENTLVLQEDGHKGDLIDLKSRLILINQQFVML